MQTGVGTRIKNAREQKCLTIDDLAAKVDIPPHELESIENGNDIYIFNWKVITAIRLACTLDLYLYEIIGEKTLNEEEITFLLSAVTILSETQPGLKMDENVAKLIQKLYKMGTGREIQ